LFFPFTLILSLLADPLELGFQLGRRRQELDGDEESQHPVTLLHKKMPADPKARRRAFSCEGSSSGNRAHLAMRSLP